MNIAESVASCIKPTTVWRLTVHGQVQSVGFRPLVFQIAHQLKINGHVVNGGVGAVIELHCTLELRDRFISDLHQQLPDIACIDDISILALENVQPKTSFTIDASQPNGVDGQVMPDLAICQHCLHDLFNKEDRHYRYPLVNCTYCGPRYSIIKSLPYDRNKTTMAPYELCESCQHDYKNPLDRRFHAQPIACPNCGPTVTLANKDGNVISCDNPFLVAAEFIRQGNIIAMKGIGGFHLVCDARNDQAVKRLRERKHRPEKPLAVMGLNTDSLEKVVIANQAGRVLLESSQAPLVIFHKRLNRLLAETLAPKLNRLGVMLPYTPMQYLLLHALANEPEGHEWLKQPCDQFLVMTSANKTGMPIVSNNLDAVVELTGIADAFLWHDREIHMRCDDAIIEATGQSPIVVRRGRGMAPNKLVIQQSDQTIVGFGAELKNTVCIVKKQNAFVSQYIGNLDNLENRQYLSSTQTHMQSVFSASVSGFACDAHPQFFSSQWAKDQSDQASLPLIRVQHHHAHAASVMAEHSIDGPCVAAVLDGFGLSEQGELWGGELLFLENLSHFQRIGHFSQLPLPGGDKASKEGWRVAVGWALKQPCNAGLLAKFSHQANLAAISQLVDKDINTPYTSSAGRLFDAAAALLGICETNSFESQAAMRLQSVAEEEIWAERPVQNASNEQNRYFNLSEHGVVNFSALLTHLVTVKPEAGAALFHRELANGICQWVAQACIAQNTSTVVLSGGCWLNTLLLDTVKRALHTEGYQVYHNEALPMNDGNISFGQAAVAAKKITELEE